MEAHQAGSKVLQERGTDVRVSVIIPVYKVEKYIERCVRSLMEQTLDDVEFIFVDDASPDSSIDIAKRVVAGYERTVRFLTHEENKGLPGARNTGLAAASGDFIYHCDSDDWLEKGMLEKMVSAAERWHADFVYCDFFLSFGEKERYMSQPHYTDKQEALQKGMLAGQMKHNVWNKLVRKSLYTDNGIKSPEEHCKGGEDYMVVKLLAVAERVAHVPEALYHYNRTNENAITRKRSEKHFEDIKANADDVLAFLRAHPIPEPRYIECFKLDVKLPFLMERDKGQYARWKSWYPEANAYIMANSCLPLRTRFLQLFAKWGLFPMVYAYSWAIPGHLQTSVA